MPPEKLPPVGPENPSHFETDLLRGAAKAPGHAERFRPGDPVQQCGSTVELLVEGYDDFGRVICSYWEGTHRERAAFAEATLEKLGLPPR